MTNWIISSSILIITVIVLRSLFKGKISLRLQYALWLLVAVRLLIPVNFGSSAISIENLTNRLSMQPKIENTADNVTGDYNRDDYENAVKIYEEVKPMTQVPENITSEESFLTPEAAATNTFSLADALSQIIFYLWILGIVVFSLIFVISNIYFGRRVKRTRQKIDVPYSKLPVYVSNVVDTPCLFGMIQPGIYVTKAVSENPMILRHSVYHEMTHYNQGDLFWTIVRCVCLVLHWYNPLVWWAAKLSKQDAELACDEATISKLGENERLEYGKTLILLTCEKRQDLFITATTMTSEGKSIKERIKLIAKKPKIAAYALIIIVLTAFIAVGCTFTSAEKEKKTVNEESISDALVVPQPEKAADSEQPQFVDEPDERKVCLAVMPDGISMAGGDYRYIIPEDQLTWMDGYKMTRSLATNNETWQLDEQSMGIWIVFNDEWTCITDQGFIFNFSSRVDREDSESFYNLCIEEAKKYHTGTPVRPADISEITSATLNYNGSYTVTDSKILADLQETLYTSAEIRGGAACPFTALLTLEFEDERVETISLATDSCCVWLSDGVYYDYSGYTDIEELYNIFSENGMKTADSTVTDTTNAEKIIAKADERLREGYVEATLTYVDNAEVGWDYYSDNPWKSDEERDALAQAAVKELYTLTGYNLKECVYTTDGRSKFIFGKSAEFIRKSIAFYSRDYGFTLCGNSMPYTGFVNARRAHYSDVQQLDSPYGKAEFSGHGAIPAWFLEHSGIYQGEKIMGFDAFKLDDTVYTHIKLLFEGGYYVVVMDEEIESVHEVMGPYESKPVLMVNGSLYYGTGEVGPMGDSGAVAGYIEFSVDENYTPTKNGESNFGCIGNPYTYGDNSIQVLMDDGEYHWFYLEDLIDFTIAENSETYTPPTSSSRISAATPVEELIWVTDQEINWTEEKETKLLQFLESEGWFFADKISFVSYTDDSMIEELKNWDSLVEQHEYNKSVAFVSVHDDSLAKKLEEADLCFEFYNMLSSENYPSGNLQEFTPCEQAREVLGDYIAYSTMAQTSDVRQIDAPLVFYYFEEIANILIE